MPNDTKLDVLIITVKEQYYIPKFLKGVLDTEGIRIVGITTVPPALGTQNLASFAWELFQRFGPRVFFKHASFYGKYTVLDLINRSTGRGNAYSAKTLAKRNEIGYHHVENINDDEYRSRVEVLSPDVIASVAATQKIEGALLDAPSNAAINIHSSLLPEYRGVSPGFWNLLNDEEQTGITVHYMNEELDSGAIIRQVPLEIREDETLHDLNERVAEKGSELLVKALDDIRTGSVTARTMASDEGSYYSLPSREDVQEFLERGNHFF